MKAYIFPGQGSQTRGMGGALFDEFKEITEAADEILGYSIKQLCVDDPKKQLNQTQFTQPALYVVNALSYYKKLEKTGEKPDFVAGHSLGEYNALLASGAFDFKMGLQLVRKRGLLMSQTSGGSMAAILGLTADKVKKILKENNLNGIDIANYNTPSQIVLSGLTDEMKKAEVFFCFEGVRYFPLNTSGAFHSRYMQQAKEEFERFSGEFTYGELAIPVISNVHARQYKQEEIIENLSDQITHSVYWSESIRHLLGIGEMEFEEIGNGAVLTKLVESIKKESAPLAIKEKVRSIKASTNGTAIDLTMKDAAKRHSGFRSETDDVNETKDVPQQQPELIFMYSGQGSHYYQMGRELYNKNTLFRDTMNECSSLLERHLGNSLVDIIYDDSKKNENFNNILYTHPAILCIQYSLTQVLHERGVRPQRILGYSLGEYIAAVVAGMLSLEDGLKLAVYQAKYLQEKCREGGMLVVLDQVASFKENQQLFQNCTLAGINYENNFIISGLMSRLKEINLQLKGNAIFSQLLAVDHAFHSELIDPIEKDFKELVEKINFLPPRIPLYSAVKRGKVLEPDDQHFWNAVRDKIQFKELVTSIINQVEPLFVDLSPTGTLSNFIKYGFGKHIPSFFTINQFGQDIKTIDKLLLDLKNHQFVV